MKVIYAKSVHFRIPYSRFLIKVFQIIYPGEQERQLNMMSLLYFDCYISIGFKSLFRLIC